MIIGEGQKKPRKYYKNNVLGTKNLISACLNTNVKNFIFSSTAAVYKDGLYKVNENSPVKPKSVYGKTKLSAEKLIIKNCKKHKINFGILRYFNIVGSSPSGKIGLINKGDHLFKNFSIQTLKKIQFIKYMAQIIQLKMDLVLEILYTYQIFQKFILKFWKR